MLGYAVMLRRSCLDTSLFPLSFLRTGASRMTNMPKNSAMGLRMVSFDVEAKLKEKGIVLREETSFPCFFLQYVFPYIPLLEVGTLRSYET